MRNLADEIKRCRSATEVLVPNRTLTGAEVKDFLYALSKEIGMSVIDIPEPTDASGWGLGGWMHIEQSGVEFMEYHRTEGRQDLITVDAYSCMEYDVEKMAEFTARYFGAVDLEHTKILPELW
jgi:hypothetical protein